MNKKTISFIFPLMHPLKGGSSSYSKLISRHLGENHNLIFLTEYVSTEPIYENNLHFKILRFLPPRDQCQHKSSLYNYSSFILTVLIIYIFTIFNMIFSSRVILHGRYNGSFYKLLHNASPFVLIDVRDAMVDVQRYGTYGSYFACSKNIKKYLEVKVSDVAYAPVPVDLHQIKKGMQIAKFNEEYTKGERYVLAACGSVVNKGYLELIHGYEQYRLSNKQNTIKLRIAGLMTSDINFVNGLTGEIDIDFLGILNEHDLYSQILNSNGVIIPGRYEGVPRVGTEASAAKKPIFVNENIEEFKGLHDWQYIKNESTVESIKEIFCRISNHQHAELFTEYTDFDIKDYFLKYENWIGK